MNKYAQRLLKLAKHLRSGKLKHDKFSYSIVSNMLSFLNGPPIKLSKVSPACGCALGECLFQFPSFFKENAEHKNLESATECYFRITSLERKYLFYPSTYENPLNYYATKTMVSKHIEDFVQKTYNLTKEQIKEFMAT